VADRLPGVRYLGSVRDPFDLCDLWQGARAAVIVDAVRTGAACGTVHVADLEASSPDAQVEADLPGLAGARTSTHGFGVAGLVRLGWAIGQAPERVVLIGIEGQDFGPGPGFSPGVAAAIPVAAGRVVKVVEELLTCA
jgi:hydrogenase maturation protease